MRCSCCDKELTDSEATAKFVEKDGKKPFRFAEMCTECLGFMPPEVRVVRRPQREKVEWLEDRDEGDPFDDDRVWDDS